MSSDIYYSAFERRENDNYPTIDTRIMDGLMANIALFGDIVDPCAREGSAIVDYLRVQGRNAVGLDDAFASCKGDWIVTNPPFAKSKVNKIVLAQIERVERCEFSGFALLVRINWDFAKTRINFFNRSSYMGEIKLLFRPFWTNDRTQEPKHNYVWHLWRRDGWAYRNIWRYLPPYDPQYTVKHAKN